MVYPSKLSLADVKRIRKRFCATSSLSQRDPKRVTQKQLADEYGVSTSLIGQVVRGAVWRHAGGPIHDDPSMTPFVD